MNFQKMLKKFDFKTFLKFAGLGVFVLIALGLLISLGSFAVRTAFNISPQYSTDSVAMSGYGGG